MAFNAQLPDYFRQFDATGGQLLDGFMDQANPAENPLAAQTPGEIASAGQGELSQLQSQISDLISGSAGKASAATLPASVAANPTPTLTSTATIPSGLSTAPTPGPVTTTTTPATTPATTSATSPVATSATTPITTPAASSDPNYLQHFYQAQLLAEPGQIAPHDPSASGGTGPYSPGGSMYGIAPSPSNTTNSGDPNDVYSDAAFEASGHPPSWYTVGATTWQDVRDSMSLREGGTNSAGQTQIELNLISQLAEAANRAGSHY